MKIANTENDWLSGDHDWESLFDELCRAHCLKWRQKWLLKNISKTLGVQPAARLFIEPDWFVSASKTKGLQHRKGQLVELCKILFHRERSDSENSPERKVKPPKGTPPKETMPDDQLAGV